MKLAINSEHLLGIILTRLDLLKKLSCSQGAGKANKKLGVDQFK
jgi:hypothetical protein